MRKHKDAATVRALVVEGGRSSVCWGWEEGEEEKCVCAEGGGGGVEGMWCMCHLRSRERVPPIHLFFWLNLRFELRRCQFSLRRMARRVDLGASVSCARRFRRPW